MAVVEQTQKMIHHVWRFPWSVRLRVGFWCLCSWFGFLGSKLIRSNNQSSTTLWVLDVCLIVGLLPFMVILITASLSSNTHNKASWFENWTFEGVSYHGKQRVSPLYHGSESCFQRLKQSDPINRVQVYRPTLKMISDSVELCETEICFLHIQLIGTNVWLPKTHTMFHRK